MTKRQAKPAAAWCACVSALVFAVGGVTAVLTATDAAAAQPVICFIGVNCGCTRNCNPPHTFAPGSVEAPPPPAPAPGLLAGAAAYKVLYRLRALMQTGEVPTLRSNPSARASAR